MKEQGVTPADSERIRLPERLPDLPRDAGPDLVTWKQGMDTWWESVRRSLLNLNVSK